MRFETKEIVIFSENDEKIFVDIRQTMDDIDEYLSTIYRGEPCYKQEYERFMTLIDQLVKHQAHLNNRTNNCNYLPVRNKFNDN